MSAQVSEPAKKKTKKRNLGTFPCQHCPKVFTRSDHLARHNLNHEPKEVFKCDFVIEGFGGYRKVCGKTFVRRDLKERHVRRHIELKHSEGGEMSNPEGSPSFSSPARKSSTSSTSDTRSQTHQPHHIHQQIQQPVQPLQSVQQPLQQVSLPLQQVQQPQQTLLQGQPLQPQQPLQISNLIHGEGQKNMLLNNGTQMLPNGQFLMLQSTGNKFTAPVINNSPSANYKQEFSTYAPQTQNDIISWLFTDNTIPQNQVIEQIKQSPAPFSASPYPNLQISPLPPSELLNHIPSPLAHHVIPQQQLQQPLHPAQIQSQNQLQQLQLPQLPQLPQLLQQPLQSQLYGMNQADFSSYSTANNFGFQDVNIFLNGDNPLDEVLLRNYQLQMMNGGPSFPPSLNPSNLPTPSVFIQSSTTDSPTTTNDSNTTPKTSVSFSPENRLTNSEPLEQKLVVHGARINIPKKKHLYIDDEIFGLAMKTLPGVSKEMIEALFKHDEQYHYTIADRLSYYISMYWLVFHQQFTILHKPSFDTKTAPPLLLLSMILLGCNYSSPTQGEILAINGKKSPEFKFSMMIATPLRYEIFQHRDFRSPVKLWVLQSLNILEWCEKNFLLRSMHERGHIHHGTTVQLLRRSPLLGGNPSSVPKRGSGGSSNNSSAGEESSDNIESIGDENADNELFGKWVESESMKRVTFMTFYLDIIDYIKFRHPPQIMFFQLQLLNLPCDDSALWGSSEVNGSFKKVVKRQRKLQQQRRGVMAKSKGASRDENFLTALKRLLKPRGPNETNDSSKFSVFSRKILLAGLVSIMYQMQQADLQDSSPLLSTSGISNNTKRTQWKETLTNAFDNWNADMIEDYSSYLLSPSTSLILNDISTSHVPIPMYHLSQIIGMSDINHYDIAIYGGSPANMSVSATNKDHLIVQNKLKAMWWTVSDPTKRPIKELINLRSVIHCYLLLWQLMLKPVEDASANGDSTQNLDWSVNRDYFDSMYAVSIATLVLWCYAYSTSGAESKNFADLVVLEGDEYDQAKMLSSKPFEELIQLSAEGGYQYLARVRQEFLTNLRKDNLHTVYNIHPFRLKHQLDDGKNISYSPSEIITKYCDLLPYISNKNNLSGLCFLVGTRLLHSQWEVIRENAKLILNCGYRSIGKKTNLCLDLFDNELK